MNSSSPRIVMLCTGNSARSVMGAVMLRHRRPDLDVLGAGTHALEGLPISARTRVALATHDLSAADHRSHQLVGKDAVDADLIVAFAPGHVAYLRRQHPSAAIRTATLTHLVDVLEAGDQHLRTRVEELDLGCVDLDDAAEVTDPAGGDEATFIACADEIGSLIDLLIPLL